jgi:hypothetical protein
MAIIKGWPDKKKECLVRRLSRYHLLFKKVEELEKPPKPSSAPTPHDNERPWFRVLSLAMRQQPVDELFHYAAYYWLLYRQRADMLLLLAQEKSSPYLERFVFDMQRFKVRTTTEPDLRQEHRELLHALVRAHEVWSRFVFVSSQESFATLDKLMESSPDDSKWQHVEEELDSGELLPRLYARQERFLEAAMAFAELAERPDSAAPQPPAPTAPGLAPAPTNPPPATSAAPSATDGPVGERARAPCGMAATRSRVAALWATWPTTAPPPAPTVVCELPVREAPAAARHNGVLVEATSMEQGVHASAGAKQLAAARENAISARAAPSSVNHLRSPSLRVYTPDELRERAAKRAERAAWARAAAEALAVVAAVATIVVIGFRRRQSHSHSQRS